MTEFQNTRTMFTSTYVQLLMKQADTKQIGPPLSSERRDKTNLQRQHSLWSSEDTGESCNTLFFLSPDDTLIHDLKQQRQTYESNTDFRKDHTHTVTWHLLPRGFNYPKGTRLMEQPCIKTNAIDTLRYCFIHPDLQSADRETFIDIIKVIMRIYPILRDESHIETRCILMYMIKHKKMFHCGQAPNIEKLTSIFQIDRSNSIKELCAPLQNIGKNFSSLSDISPDNLAKIKVIANIHPPTHDIERKLIELQKEIQSMDEKHQDLFVITAYTYRKILEIQPFDTHNKYYALYAVNHLLNRKNFGSIRLSISLETIDLNRYCLMMQSKNLEFLARSIKKQYILYNPDSEETQKIITQQPGLMRQVLCNLIINNEDTYCIELCRRINSKIHREKILNTPLSDGWTILHFACKENKKVLITQLLELGANPHIQNHNQKTPFDLITQVELKNKKNQLTELPTRRTPERRPHS